jgi:oxygen-dependent protoporphyrinogen oxidase
MAPIVNSASPIRQRVVVIGGGISGLAAAHRLTELDPALDLLVLEAAGRLGGVLETVHRDGYLIERSADNFISNVPWALDLCRRIGFSEQLIPTSTEQRQAMVVCRGRLERVPEGFMLMAPRRLWPLVTTPILSPGGKLRLLGELFVSRRRESSDESLAAFTRRRFGREAFERIVQPLVGGIYAADPEKLSLRATLPRFIDMEQIHGGLLKAAWKTRNADDGERGSGARYGLFVAPRDGMSSLVQAIAARLPTGGVRLRQHVEQLTPNVDGSWKIAIEHNGSRGELQCDAVIVTAGAPSAARLLRATDPTLANRLAEIPYAGTSVVTLAYRRDQVSRGLDSFGFVVPALEGRQILAASFSSVKFPGRAPEGMVLVRVFIGGACQSELANLNDDRLLGIATGELAELAGVRGEPLLSEISRWPASMPQYHLGHCERVEAIERAAQAWPTLALAGNAYRGVGIPHCIRSGEAAAEHIAAALAARQPAS